MGGSGRRPITVQELRDSLANLPGDTPVLAYCGISEDIDGIGLATFHETVEDAQNAHYYQAGSDAVESCLGRSVKVEPGTGTQGRDRNYIWVPYKGPVVIL